MGSWKAVGIFILFLAAGALAAWLVSSWYNTLPSPGEKSVEVREYRGEMLSSIGDFRENSIKCPQYGDRFSNPGLTAPDDSSPDYPQT